MELLLLFRKRRLRPKRRNGKSAQASLEIALSLICVFLLLLGALKIFLWVNSRLVMRQEDYEKSRVWNANIPFVLMPDESKFPKLDIFGNTEPYIPKEKR